MSDLLKKVAPLISLYFSKEGVSATIANQRKVELANENSQASATLKVNEFYNTKMTMMNSKSESVREVKVRKIFPDNFKILQQISENNGEAAILGNGIKVFNLAIEKIQSISAEELCRMNTDSEIILKVPTKIVVITTPINSAMTFERIEDLLTVCTSVALEKLDAEMVKKALRLESEAATLGLEITKKESFLQRLLSASPTLKSDEVIATSNILLKEYILAYSEEEIQEFKQLFEKLQKQYQNLQGQLNGLKKSIKDTIRIADFEASEIYEKELREYNLQLNAINAAGESLRQQLVKELLELKIQIA